MLAGGSPCFERSRHRALRHCRTRALTRHAISENLPPPPADSVFITRKPRRRLAVLRTSLRRFENPYAPSFGSERITAFFRHHDPDGLGNLPSRQHTFSQKRSQTAFRDVDASSVQHLLHLSHRHPFGLLFDQPLPQTVQHIRQAQLRRHKFRQLPVYGIEVDIRFVEATLPSKARHRLEQRCRPRCRAMSGRR